MDLKINNSFNKDCTKKSKPLKKAALVSLGSIERLKLVKEVLKDEYSVTMFLSDFDHNRKAEVSNKDPECVYLHIPPYKKNLSFQRIFSLLSYGRQIGRQINELDPDLLYIILPPNNMVKNCETFLSAKLTASLVLDIYDLWPESLPIQWLKNTFPIKEWTRWRNRNLEKAKIVFTECQLYQDVLRSQGNDLNYKTLYLCKSQREEMAVKVNEVIDSYNQQNKEKDRLRLGYLGSINHIVHINAICGFIAELNKRGKSVEVDIVGEGENSQQFIHDLGQVGATVRYHGPVYDEMMILKYLGKCDFGINMMKPGVQVGLTTKSLDYLSMGIPLLNNIKHDTWNLIQEEGIGINIPDEKGNIDGLINEVIDSDLFQMKKKALLSYNTHFTPSSFKKTVKEAFRGEGILLN